MEPRQAPEADTAGAAIPFPPPVAYFAGMAIGFALHYFFPLPLVVSPRAVELTRLLGWVLFVLASSLVISAVVSFRRARTTHDFSRPSTSLITSGPFRLSRNPAYLAGALVHSGLALLANALWPLLLLLPALVVVNNLITREEQYLARRFGLEYEAYRHRVRRWV